MVRHRRVLSAVSAVLGASFLLLFVARLIEPLGLDQGLFACFTRWVPRGALPYRDLFDSKPPLFLYWWGLARVVPGELPRAVWWFEGIWLSATLAVAYALGARLYGRVAGVASASLLLVGLWAPSFGGYWSRAQAEEVLALPMLLSAWACLRAIEHERAALTAGVLAGVCGLFKIPSMAIVLAWSVAWFAHLPLRATLRRVLLLGGGVLIPWSLALGWFAAHGATTRFYEGVFQYHRYNAEFIAPPWDAVLAQFATEVLRGALLPLVAAFIGVALLARRRAPHAAWLGAWIACALAAVALQRQLAGYHFLLFAPALAIAGGRAVAVLVRSARARGRPRLVGAFGLAVLAALAVRTATGFAEGYAPAFEHSLGRIDRPTYLRRIQQGRLSHADEEAIARYLREHTAKDDGILVFGLAPAVYALADRHPTTRYPFHKVLLGEARFSRMIPGLDARRAELLARLELDPPRYVLVGHDDSNPFDPLPSDHTLARWTALSAWLERGYAPETTMGRFTLYRRRAA